MRIDRGLSVVGCALLSAALQFPGEAQPSSSIADVARTSVTPVATDGPASGRPSEKSSLPPIKPLANPILPAPRETQSLSAADGVQWRDLSRAAGRFLALEHSFRLLTEPGTRSGLKGSFFQNYGRAVSNLHGWADGDEFYVNYVGHPMQGSVAGYLWVQNDRAYREVEFGADPRYWNSRFRAAAFIWAYSTQFEIGPFSEASIGGIQASFPQQGFVDHVITPSIGVAWMLGEDAVDRFLIKRVENWTTNRWARLLARSTLNPTRTLANVLDGRAPWSRESRLGISSYLVANDSSGVSARRSPALFRPTPSVDAALAPPFEFTVTFQPERFWSSGRSTTCLGGGANAGFRLAPSWQLVGEVAGCKMLEQEKNVSGDSLTYLVGPRWLTHIRGAWTGHLHVLVGGNKITEERMQPELKRLLDTAARAASKLPPSHAEYTQETEANGFTVATGAGLNYSLNRALSITVADVSYRYRWTSPLWGRDYSNSLKVSSGIVLRMGTW